jgi:hypothetical protein
MNTDDLMLKIMGGSTPKEKNVIKKDTIINCSCADRKGGEILLTKKNKDCCERNRCTIVYR